MAGEERAAGEVIPAVDAKPHPMPAQRGDRMKRREFIAGVSAAALSSSVHALSPPRPYRIGVLDTSSRPLNANFVTFQQALRERGFVEGENVTFEYRSADGRNESFAGLAGELVRLDVDVIVTRGTPAALAAAAATTTVPVVMAAVGDPVAIVRGRRSGNMTGFGAYARGIEGKRVAILKDMLPKLERVAALMNLSNPSRQAEWRETEASARSLGIAAQVLDTRTIADLERSFDAASHWPADALVVGSDTVMQTNQALVVALAAAHRVPAMYTFRDFVDAGGFASYGVSLPDLYRRAAAYVDKILKGARPDELPVEQPAKFELVINLQAAKAAGVVVPDAVLSRAEVIR
jgi:putative tryptophan/tyrosine transport system substrate-binding protein